MAGVSYLVARVAEVERRLRGLEARFRDVSTGLRSIASLEDKLGGLGGSVGIDNPIFNLIWGNGGYGSGGVDTIGWPSWWVPPGDWTGLDEFPTGDWSDSDTSGPWGDQPPPDDQAVRLSKYMHDTDNNIYLGNYPVTLTQGGTSVTLPTADAGVHGRTTFRVKQGATYTLTWPAMNGYPGGSESISIGANGGGVMTKTNEVSKDTEHGGTGWDSQWVPPNDWSGVDQFPPGSWTDQDTTGPWGSNPPPNGQAVRISKYMKDFATNDSLKFMTVTVTGPGGSFTLQTDENGRLAFRVRQGGTYTISWPAMNGYPSGSESVTVGANAGGVDVRTNRVTADSNWPSQWSPPSNWTGADQFPSGTWSDDDTSGPWGSSPPPAGQAVRLSKYMRDATTNALIGSVPVTVTGSGGSASANTGTSGANNGRSTFRVKQGGTYTVSWTASGNYGSGSESVTISANAGGVHSLTNQINQTQTNCTVAFIVYFANQTQIGLVVTISDVNNPGVGVQTHATAANGVVTFTVACGTSYNAEARIPDAPPNVYGTASNVAAWSGTQSPVRIDITTH